MTFLLPTSHTADRTEEIRLTQQTSIEALATLSEYHDTDTGDHIHRIRNFVRVLAQWLKHHHSEYGVLSESTAGLD